MATNAEELQDLPRQIEELRESMLEPSDYIDHDARAILEKPVEGFRTFVILGFSSVVLRLTSILIYSKLTDLNAQLETAIRSRQYIDAESVSKILNNIKSSLDRAIRDLTVHSLNLWGQRSPDYALYRQTLSSRLLVHRQN